MELSLLHPKIVHLPIALAVLMPLLTGGLLLAWWRDWLPRKTWIIAVVMQGLLVASGFLAIQTGEADEEIVERVVAEQYIEAHEEAADVFVWVAVAALLLFAAAAAIRNDGVAKSLGALSLAGTVAVLGMGYRVGEAGGALVYEHGAASAFAPATGAVAQGPDGAEAGQREDDDD